MSSDTTHDHGSSPRSHQSALYHECSLGLYRAWDRLVHSDRSGLIPFLFTCLDHFLLLLPDPESYALKIAAQRSQSVKALGSFRPGKREWQILSTCSGHITKEKARSRPSGPEEWIKVGKHPRCTLSLALELIEPPDGPKVPGLDLERAIGELREQLNRIIAPSAKFDLMDAIARSLENGVFELSQRADRTDRAEKNERVESQPNEKVIVEVAERAARHLAGHIVELNDLGGGHGTDRTTFAIRAAIPSLEAHSRVWIAKPGSRRRRFGRQVIEQVDLSDAEHEPQLAPALHRAFTSGFLTRGRRTTDKGHDCHVLCIPCHFEGVPWIVICFEYKVEDDPVKESLSQLRAFWKYEEISRGTTADIRQEGQAALGAAMDRLWRRATRDLQFHNEESVMKSINDEWNQLGYVFPVCPIVDTARNPMLPMLHPWPFDLGKTKSTPFLKEAVLVLGSADGVWAQAPETTSEWQVPRIEKFFWEYSRKAPDRLGENLVEVEKIKEFIQQKDRGIIVVTGAAGSGKTTMLATLFLHLRRLPSEITHSVVAALRPTDNAVEPGWPGSSSYNSHHDLLDKIEELRDQVRPGQKFLVGPIETNLEKYKTPPGIFLLYESRIPLPKSESENTTHLLHIDMDKSSESRGKNMLLELEKRKDAKLDLMTLATHGLNRNERLIIILHYYEELTMKEIGDVLELPESRVSQMHSSIVTRLQEQVRQPGQDAGRELSTTRRLSRWFRTSNSEQEEVYIAPDAAAHAASEDRRLSRLQRAAQDERRNRFSHELKHLSRAFSEYWYLEPDDKVRKAASDLYPNLEQSKWRIVPFPDILYSLRGLFQVWCGYTTPTELFGPKDVPTSMKQLVSSCFKLMRDSLKPLSCTKLSVEASVTYEKIDEILKQIDTLWSGKNAVLEIDCEDNVPNPPDSWAEDYEQYEDWLFFTQLLLAIFSDVVCYADPRKPIKVSIRQDEVNSDHIRLEFTNGVPGPEADPLFAEIRRAREQLRPLAPNREDIKTRQVVEEILTKLSEYPEFVRDLDKAKRFHTASCKVQIERLSEK